MVLCYVCTVSWLSLFYDKVKFILYINTPLSGCFRWRECRASRQKKQNRILEMPNVSSPDTPLALSHRELTVVGFLPTVHTASVCLLFRELLLSFRSLLSVPIQYNSTVNRINCPRGTFNSAILITIIQIGSSSNL